MGINRENGGYSAAVEGFLIIGGEKLRLAKSNGRTLSLTKPCELPPGANGELLVIVDGHRDSKQVVLPSGCREGQIVTEYEVVAPF